MACRWLRSGTLTFVGGKSACIWFVAALVDFVVGLRIFFSFLGLMLLTGSGKDLGSKVSDLWMSIFV